MKVAAAFLLAGTTALAADGWVELESGPITVFTDAGEREGRRCLERLEELRRVLASQWESSVPVQVLLFRRESDYARYRPDDTVRGFFQSGAEHHFIALSAGFPEWLRVVSHEYVHLLLHHTTAPLPKWLEEGLAEFYSTAEIRSEEGVLGRPVAVHIATLRRQAWLDAVEVLSGAQILARRDGAAKTAVFYAQSWALVHMLMLDPAYRGRLDHFLRELGGREPEMAVFRQVFGRRFDEAVMELRRYADRATLPLRRVRLNHSPADPEIAVRDGWLSARLARVELALLTGRAEWAEFDLGDLEQRHANSPEAQTALGMFALGARDTDRAERHMLRAMELGSRQSLPYFEYALLLRERGEPPDRVLRYLREAIDRNPQHAEAHFILGLALARERDDAVALEHFATAARLLPRQSSFWHALALCHHRLGDASSAEAAARRALQAAATPEQIEMAEAAIRLAVSSEAPPPVDRPAVQVGKAWQRPQPDRRIDGVLRRIECLGERARIYVQTDSETVKLLVREPDDVVLRNLGEIQFEFGCGPQQARPVVIEYLARPDRRMETQGDVLVMEFPAASR